MVRRAAEDGARRHVRRADRGRIWVISCRRSGSCSSAITVGEPWPTGPRQKRHINDRDPRTRFEGGFGGRSTAVGARGSWSTREDLIDFAAKHLHEAIGVQSSGPSGHVWRPPGANVALGARRAPARWRLRGAHGGGGAKIWALSSSCRWVKAVEHSLALDPTGFHAASESHVDGDGPKPTRSRAARGRTCAPVTRTLALSTPQTDTFAT